jgi:hypothetical protein
VSLVPPAFRDDRAELTRIALMHERAPGLRTGPDAASPLLLPPTSEIALLIGKLLSSPSIVDPVAVTSRP